MIKGTGIDIEETDRIRESVKSKSFRERIFLPEETAYALSRPDPALHFAARFCAKEAFAKACGSPQLWLEVCVVNDDKGAPSFALTGKAAELTKGCRVHLSLTHSKKYAAAVVVIEETNETG
ncbi:MAG: holo-ACP synthase [Abditibacteriota bacterium]|nr:holo-ACP synthase [Abditibacteriota bacterium]